MRNNAINLIVTTKCIRFFLASTKEKKKQDRNLLDFLLHICEHKLSRVNVCHTKNSAAMMLEIEMKSKADLCGILVT